MKSLRRCFSPKDVWLLVEDGRLSRWLLQKGETSLNEKVEAFKKENSGTPDLTTKEGLSFVLKLVSLFFDDVPPSGLPEAISYLRTDYQKSAFLIWCDSLCEIGEDLFEEFCKMDAEKKIFGILEKKLKDESSPAHAKFSGCLGYCYMEGHGCEKNLDKAESYLKVAKEKCKSEPTCQWIHKKLKEIEDFSGHIVSAWLREGPSSEKFEKRYKKLLDRVEAESVPLADRHNLFSEAYLEAILKGGEHFKRIDKDFCSWHKNGRDDSFPPRLQMCVAYSRWRNDATNMPDLCSLIADVAKRDSSVVKDFVLRVVRAKKNHIPRGRRLTPDFLDSRLFPENIYNEILSEPDVMYSKFF